MRWRNAVMHIARSVLKDPTQMIMRLLLSSAFLRARRQDAFARPRNRRRESDASARSLALMDSGEIILAEYQMSGKDCRIIQTRGY